MVDETAATDHGAPSLAPGARPPQAGVAVGRSGLGGCGAGSRRLGAVTRRLERCYGSGVARSGLVASFVMVVAFMTGSAAVPSSAPSSCALSAQEASAQEASAQE